MTHYVLLGKKYRPGGGKRIYTGPWKAYEVNSSGRSFHGLELGPEGLERRNIASGSGEYYKIAKWIGPEGGTKNGGKRKRTHRNILKLPEWQRPRCLVSRDKIISELEKNPKYRMIYDERRG